MTHIHTTQLAETNVLSSKNSIVSFRVLLKILKFGGSNVFKRNLIFARRTKNFWLVEVNFFHFSDIPARKRYFLSIGNAKTVFSYFPSLILVETNLFGKDFVPVGRHFPPSVNCFLLFRASLWEVETATATS